MQKLTNGYGILVKQGRRYLVKAVFRGNVEIVFEGISRKECIHYCHVNGMKAIDEGVYLDRINPWFVKKNAKHPFNPDEWRLGIVG